MLPCSGVALCKFGHPRVGDLNKAYIQEISVDRTMTRSCARRAGLYIDHPESLTADNSIGDAGLPDRGSVGTKLLGTERTSDYFFRPRSNKSVFH
jgi:hypothetical protein